MKICLQSVPHLKMFVAGTGSRSWSGGEFSNGRMMSYTRLDFLSRMMSSHNYSSAMICSQCWTRNDFVSD